MATINMLGEVAAYVGGRFVDLGPARQRCVLAALAVDAGRLVTVDRLVERVWGSGVPDRALRTLYSYISRLRRALDGVEIARRSGGYVLTAPDTDLLRFRELCARARGNDDAEAVRVLTEALALWRGDALTGLEGDWAQAERDRLHLERLAAEHDLVDARLRAGHGDALLAELTTRVAAHPLDERVAGQYMSALAGAGRAADALEHYRRFRDRLVEELGTDPGPALRELHRGILGADTTFAEPGVVPRQLPALPAPFVGRAGALGGLDAGHTGAGAPVVISAIAGAGGIGKTCLALHWAHRHADRFPDGQLFVDLRGFSPAGPPMAPAVALRGFLDALGVEPGRVPADQHAQSALFRSLVAGKRLLLVLDNAADTAQVTPLLPGSGTCTVVVTSRNRLPGLVTGHGAQPLLLDVLSGVEARALLTKRLGAARVEADSAAADELIALCGGFPLALSIVAGQASIRPHLSLAGLAAELRDLGLDALDSDDPTASLPAVLSWSHRAMTPAQAEAFAVLGIAPGPDVGIGGAAALTGLPPAEARAMLRGLEQASVLAQDAGGRYRMHDLIRRYAVDTARHLPEETRTAALRRVLDHYVHSAYAAERVLDPHRQPIDLAPPAEGAHPAVPRDIPAAMAWFDAEHANLLAAQRTAATRGWHTAVWQLAWTLTIFHIRHGYLRDRLDTWRAAVDASAHLPDPVARILAHRHLGIAAADLGRHDEAATHLHKALDLAEQYGDRFYQAHVHRVISRAVRLRGDERKSLDHATQALRLFRELDEPVWEAEALNCIGMVSAVLGETDVARDRCLAALELVRRHHDVDGEANILDSLGTIEHDDGDHRAAVDYYRRSVAAYRSIGNEYQAADTLALLGNAHAALGEHDEAGAVWREAMAVFLTQRRASEAKRVRLLLDGLGSTALT
jgi:DNA-binding SARP family transcriptional activator/tetratricopeptide (TPR) repeat protein